MDLHEALTPLAHLLGTWRGQGRGEYPTIEPFDYGEEVSFRHVGKPFLVYTQRTWALDTEQPMHAETGYWRHTGQGRLEVILAHPFGAGEVLEGTVEQRRIRLVSHPVVTTSAAKRIDATERDVDLDGDTLSYRLRMAAVGEPMTHHLAAELHRVV
jgi:hypothetical protein